MPESAPDLLADVPARRDDRVKSIACLLGRENVTRVLGPLAYQDPSQKFDPIIFSQHAGLDHPIILINRDSVHVRRRWER